MDRLRADLHHWMFDTALPFWGSHGIDHECGGFVEEMDLLGRPRNDVKRVRVLCRQIYVFSHAATLGWHEGQAFSEMGYRFLTERAWLGPRSGWARALNRRGDVLDRTPDLYDIAFVLFALAWRHRASGDPEAVLWAHRTLDFLDERMRHPSGKGFLHTLPTDGPRLQNPHMHLLEAALALMEACSHPRFQALADEVVELFTTYFYDARSQTLAEYFNEDWTRLDGETGRIVEPGHQFEWAWILNKHQRLTGNDHRELARGLVDFAEAYGVDRSSWATYNAVRNDGTPIDRGSRTWPNAERMKAAITMYELFDLDPSQSLRQSGRLLLDRYLAIEPHGVWLDEFDAQARPISTKIPASTLYHVFLAFTETLRITDALPCKPDCRGAQVLRRRATSG